MLRNCHVLLCLFAILPFTACDMTPDAEEFSADRVLDEDGESLTVEIIHDEEDAGELYVCRSLVDDVDAAAVSQELELTAPNGSQEGPEGPPSGGPTCRSWGHAGNCYSGGSMLNYCVRRCSDGSAQTACVHMACLDLN